MTGNNTPAKKMSTDTKSDMFERKLDAALQKVMGDARLYAMICSIDNTKRRKKGGLDAVVDVVAKECKINKIGAELVIYRCIMKIAEVASEEL